MKKEPTTIILNDYNQKDIIKRYEDQIERLKKESALYGYEHSIVVKNEARVEALKQVLDDLNRLFLHSKTYEPVEDKIPYEIDLAKIGYIIVYFESPYRQPIGSIMLDCYKEPNCKIKYVNRRGIIQHEFDKDIIYYDKGYAQLLTDELNKKRTDQYEGFFWIAEVKTKGVIPEINYRANYNLYANLNNLEKIIRERYQNE